LLVKYVKVPTPADYAPAPQAMIVRYVPILGPVVGSAFIIGLYMLSRLVKGAPPTCRRLGLGG
jgi:hypothetical protein